MKQIADRFAERFAHWNITLPPENVRRRQRGKIVQGGGEIAEYHEDIRHVHVQYPTPGRLPPAQSYPNGRRSGQPIWLDFGMSGVTLVRQGTHDLQAPGEVP